MNELVDNLRPAPSEAPEPPPPAPTPGPLLQSVVIGFRAVYAVVALMALVWLFSNVSVISPGNQAVVMQFGRIVRSQDTGLLIAWPRPIEDVRILPGPARQLSQTVTPLPASTPTSEEGESDTFLTGDNNVVMLHATLLYRIVDAKGYVLAETHVQPALDRLFHSAAVSVTAARNLNDFLPVLSTDGGAASGASLRQAVLDDLVAAMNKRLARLAADGASLGVEIQRVDTTPSLPASAKASFDMVLTATQDADQRIAGARTSAETARQNAARQRDSLLAQAEATSRELVSTATVDTATIEALSKEATPATHAEVVWRAYREHIANVLAKAGSVTVVDPKTGPRLILPGRH